MFTGGCTGSTSGSLKAARILIILQAARREIMRVIHPRAVVSVRLAGRAIPDEMVNSVLTFFAIFIFLFALGAVLLASMGIGLSEAIAASAASITNVGPALGSIGPEADYSHYPGPAKVLLSLFMWLGRLEIFAGLVILFPASYKK
jgi:trk system potassium uptake protein TrkH